MVHTQAYTLYLPRNRQFLIRRSAVHGVLRLGRRLPGVEEGEAGKELGYNSAKHAKIGDLM